MGNRFGKERETNAETAEEAKTAEESEAGQPAEDSGITQTQTKNLQGQVVQLVSSITEELVLQSGVGKVADVEPKPVETPAPVQPDPLLSVGQSSAPASKPVAEAPLAAEPVPEPLPEPEPEAVPQPDPIPEPLPEPEPEAVPQPDPIPEPMLKPEPVSKTVPVPEPEPEAEVEVASEPISELVPAATEAAQRKTDLLSHESLPERAIFSPPLINLGAPEEDAQPVDLPPSTAPVDAKEPADIPATEECQHSAEVSVVPTFEPEKEASEAGEKATEAEGGVRLEQLVSEVSDESLSGLLKNLELKGNDLVADLIPADVQIPDDVSTSTELM
ncbi:uncharacterized protein AB9W97_012371 isoform 1-T1 [Spinachia spinachia]